MEEARESDFKRKEVRTQTLEFSFNDVELGKP